MPNSDYRHFYSEEAAGYEAKRYGTHYGRLFRVFQRAAVERALTGRRRSRKILDVASGTGQMLPSLAAAGDMVVASDLTPAMLCVARECNVMRPFIAYCVADAMRLPYADSTFDAVASSRFLHLFDIKQQQKLVVEMARVLAPGGILIVDFYSANARRIFGPPIWIYRKLLRKRPENDCRVSLSAAREMLQQAGLCVDSMEGIGNFFLVPFLWLPQSWLSQIGSWLGRHCAVLSEQFIVVARKS